MQLFCAGHVLSTFDLPCIRLGMYFTPLGNLRTLMHRTFKSVLVAGAQVVLPSDARAERLAKYVARGFPYVEFAEVKQALDEDAASAGLAAAGSFSDGFYVARAPTIQALMEETRDLQVMLVTKNSSMTHMAWKRPAYGPDVIEAMIRISSEPALDITFQLLPRAAAAQAAIM